MTGTTAYVLSKKYIDDSLIGIGALAGAPCEVDSITKVGNTTTVTLKWEDTTGVSHTSSFNINDGVGIDTATIDSNGDLIIVLTDGTSINCGKVNSQFTTLPTPSASNVGAILQYVGPTTPDYTNGYFYECVLDGSTYKWVQKAVQPGGGGSSQVVTLPPASPSELGNIYQYVGNSTLLYDNGCFYKCVYNTDTSTYEWDAILVQAQKTYEDDPIDFNNF